MPRRRTTYKDVPLEEMDLPGIIERRPELALIDELAHTNAPGLEHGKRYEDIADVLGAGIDVFSTVNVQHLESLNDQVAELTGVRVRETFPDSVLSAADEVVLVDLTPPALIERLRAGKVYPAARVPAALNGFFRVENLEALREVALRQVAEDVEAKRLRATSSAARGPPDGAPPRRSRRRAAAGAGHAAAVVAADHAPRVALGAAARRGAGRADRARRASRPTPSASRSRRSAGSASLLGAEVLVEEGDDVPEVAARVARRAALDVRADRHAGAAARARAGSPSR